MYDDFETAYNWVLPKYEYENDEFLIESVSKKYRASRGKSKKNTRELIIGSNR
jgi:hypothetical protein